MDQLRFSIPEILSLFGVAQCVYVLVYIGLRAGKLSHAAIPLVYFFVLGLAFFTDFASGYIGGLTKYYFQVKWLAWFMGPPLSVLLVMQIAEINKTPSLGSFWPLLLVPLALLISQMSVASLEECGGFQACQPLQEWLIATGSVAGALSLLAIWLKRGLFTEVQKQKSGKERYWLIISLIMLNIFLLIAMLASLTPYMSLEEGILARTFLGLAFVYIVTTSLLRIYPQALVIKSEITRSDLSEEDLALALKIENFLSREKVYQEPSYSRADLARECGASEMVLSKVINVYFKKSFPQLMNEHRVREAKALLRDTKAPVKTVAEEVGFNSLASFNRVFKDIAGSSPSVFRRKSQS